MTVTTARPAWWLRLGDLVRTLIGAPSYERYLAHVSVAHPDDIPLGRETFIRQRMEARYSRPGSRCC